MKWTVETIGPVVDAEIEALPADMRAKLVFISNIIESMGLQQVREPYVKHIRGTLWEMRMTGKDGISRALYVTAVGKRVMIARVFVKKTQRTPVHEIELAVKRLKEWTE
jgi:phage-related protein